MKQIITEKFLKEKMVGRFVVQISADAPDTTITESNWEFIKEKRLSMICWDLMQEYMYFQGLFYAHSKPMKPAELVEKFNNYQSNIPNNERFYRLLTKSELEFIFKKFQESNY
jgi:hypothetical protein